MTDRDERLNRRSGGSFFDEFPFEARLFWEALRGPVFGEETLCVDG